MTTFYSFPANFGESPREIHIPIMGRITAQSIVDEAEDILLAPPTMVVTVAPGSDMEQGSAIQHAVDRVMGDALTRRHGHALDSLLRGLEGQLIVNQFMLPFGGTAEELRRLFESMGLGSGLREFERARGLELAEAKTLRQRCFARLVNGFDRETGIIRMAYAGQAGIKIAPFKNTLRSLMPACYRNKKLRKDLASIPIATGPGRSNGNPELVEPLQDLANIITYEIRLAYEDDYYPGVPDVDPMTEEHVDQIMVAMQREIDREQRYADGRTRWKTTVHLPDLPRERKTALAERRRHWFGVFGITPKSWKTGKWSLWKVRNVAYPEGYKIPAW